MTVLGGGKGLKIMFNNMGLSAIKSKLLEMSIMLLHVHHATAALLQHRLLKLSVLVVD